MKREGQGQQEPELKVTVQGQWVAAPVEIMEDTRLPAPARLVMVYLLGLAGRPNWTIRVGQVQRALGMSQGTWQRARKSLQSCGYYLLERTRDADGTMNWQHSVFYPTRGAALGSFSTDGQSTGGKRAVVRSLHNTKTMKQKQKQKQNRSAAADGKGAGKRGGLWNGVEIWTASDEASVSELLATHGEAAVQAAALQLRRRGERPLPIAVARELANGSPQQRSASTGGELARVKALLKKSEKRH